MVGRRGVQYCSDIRKAAFKLRYDGFSLREIAEQLDISKSTASLWCRDVPIGAQGSDRLKLLQTVSDADLKLLNNRRLQHLRRKRLEWYKRGYHSNPTKTDALCVGLYMGDGTKRSASRRPSWSFANSNRAYIRLLLEWGVRAGQPSDAFKLFVMIPAASLRSDTEAIGFWGSVGVSSSNIWTSRISPVSSKHVTEHRTPYGTCTLRSIKNGVYLFVFFLGQQDYILGVPERDDI